MNKNKWIRILLAGVIFCAFGIMFIPFLTPILMAALFAFALDPLVASYSPKRAPRRVPITLVLLFFFAATGLPLGLVIYRLTVSAKKIAQSGISNTPIFKSLEHFTHKVALGVDKVFERLQLEPLASTDPNEYVGKIGTWFVTKMADLASQAPEMILSLFIFSAALCYFLAESKNIRQSAARFSFVTKTELDQIIQVVQRSSYVTLVAQVLIGATQAIIVALGALLFGYSETIIIFVVTFCASLIPVIGASPVSILLALFSLMQGDVRATIGLAVVSIVAGTIDNILKPYIVSHSGDKELNPVIALVAIIGAVIVYGLPGLLLGPILTTLAHKIVPILFQDESTPEDPK